MSSPVAATGPLSRTVVTIVVTTGMALVASLLLLGTVMARPAAAQRPAVSTPTLKTYPLQRLSLASHLKRKGRAKLPTVRTWATEILGEDLDQTGGLTEVQTVSALHIRRAFMRKVGSAGAESAIRIAWRESRLLPNVVNDRNRNKTMDWGLFQLNDGGTLQYVGGEPNERALRPRWNARAAARLVLSVGWEPWGGMLTASE